MRVIATRPGGTSQEFNFESVAWPDDEISSYTAGLLLTDGWREGNRIRLRQKAANAPTLMTLADCLSGTYGSITMNRLNGKEYPGLTVQFRKLPLTWTSSPIFFEDEQLEAHYWRGVFDGDGSWSCPPGNRNPRVRFCEALHEHAVGHAFSAFCSEHGYSPSSYIQGQVRYHQFSVKQSSAVARHLYEKASIFLPEKRRRALLAL